MIPIPIQWIKQKTTPTKTGMINIIIMFIFFNFSGNDWGICPNGTGMVGCNDKPEQFFACADIAIV